MNEISEKIKEIKAELLTMCPSDQRNKCIRLAMEALAQPCRTCGGSGKKKTGIIGNGININCGEVPCPDCQPKPEEIDIESIRSLCALDVDKENWHRKWLLKALDLLGQQSEKVAKLQAENKSLYKRLQEHVTQAENSDLRKAGK